LILQNHQSYKLPLKFPSGIPDARSSDCDPDHVYTSWIEDLKLHESDHVSLNGGEERTENIVNAAQTIMNMQFLNF